MKACGEVVWQQGWASVEAGRALRRRSVAAGRRFGSELEAVAYLRGTTQQQGPRETPKY